MNAAHHIRSNVVAYVALFFALSGGAYAIKGQNTVNSGDVVNSSLTSKDIKNGRGVGSQDLIDGSIQAEDIDAGAVQHPIDGTCEATTAIGGIGVGGGVSCTETGGKIVAGFSDGPAAIEPNIPLGQLRLPAGSYAVFAKLWIDGHWNSTNEVTCKLLTESDSDRTVVLLSNRRDAPNPSASVSLMLVHHFPENGLVSVSCFDIAPFEGEAYFGDATWHDLKIIAIKTPSLSNEFLG